MTTGAGETDLGLLLADMRPRLWDEVYAYAVAPAGADLSALAPVLSFEEAEGTTLVAPRAALEAAGLETVYPCRMITLEVRSALEAVGFLAAVTTHLAGLGVSVNPVSAYHHDHLFVPVAQAEAALAGLRALAAAHDVA